MSLKLLVKSLLPSVFLLVTINKKTVNKTTCRMLSADPCQLCAH